MPDEKKEPEKKPKDISKLSTADLIKEFATMEAQLNTALNKEASRQLKFPPADEDDLKETESARVHSTVQNQERLLKDKGEKEYRESLEKSYRAVEKIKNDPKEFQKKVDILKKRFTGELNINPADKAYILATVQPESTLWNEIVSNALTTPAAKKNRGAPDFNPA